MVPPLSIRLWGGSAMKFSVGLLVLVLTYAFAPVRAFACNENCGQICAFSLCHHDDACELRNSICKLPGGGPIIIDTPGSPLGLGGLLGKGGPGVGPVSGEH